MEEMMEETLDSVDADDELEEEADAEVDKVLFELTDGKLGQAGKVGSELPVRSLPLSCNARGRACMLIHGAGTKGGRGRERGGNGEDATRDERVVEQLGCRKVGTPLYQYFLHHVLHLMHAIPRTMRVSISRHDRYISAPSRVLLVHIDALIPQLVFGLVDLAQQALVGVRTVVEA